MPELRHAQTSLLEDCEHPVGPIVESVARGDNAALIASIAPLYLTYGLTDEPCFVVIYSDNVLHGWENKSQDKGRWSQQTVDGLEKQLRPLRAGDKVMVDETARGEAAA